MEEKKIIEMNIADTLMERPYGFRLDGRYFYLYPVTLGKTYLLSRIIEALGINMEIVKANPYMEAIRLCREKKEAVCRLISYHTFNKKDELFDDELVDERCSFFKEKASDEDLAQLLVMVLTHENVDTFIHHLGIDRERKDLERVMSVKKDSNQITFFGKSVFGSLIVPACEKLNMTPHQVVWEISYNCLQMLMADAVTTVYLSDDEMKKARVSKSREIIKADDPRNYAKIKAMKWN